MACIYGLVDPRDNKVFYVGQTKHNMKFRISQHKHESKHGTKTKDKLIRNIYDDKHLNYIILEWVYNISNLDNREQFWINKYKKINLNLTNTHTKVNNFNNHTIHGENHYCSKLNKQDVLEIIDLYQYTAMSIREIAKLYNITSGTMGAITRGKNWKHVTGGKLKSNYKNKKLERPKGSKCSFSKLTEDKVREIRELLKSNSINTVAKEFGVSASAINHIKQYRVWKHI